MSYLHRAFGIVVASAGLCLATTTPAIATTQEQSYTWHGTTYTSTDSGRTVTATPTPGEPDRLPAGIDPASVPDIGELGPLTPTPDHILGNGCTGAPDAYLDANFRPACDTHDACYSKDSTTDRLACDNSFWSDLLDACEEAYPVWVDPRRVSCDEVTSAYYGAVRGAGWNFYEGQGNPL